MLRSWNEWHVLSDLQCIWYLAFLAWWHPLLNMHRFRIDWPIDSVQFTCVGRVGSPPAAGDEEGVPVADLGVPINVQGEVVSWGVANSRSYTGWQFWYETSFCWHKFTSCVVYWTKTKLITSSPQKLVSYQNCHPVAGDGSELNYGTILYPVLDMCF